MQDSDSAIEALKIRVAAEKDFEVSLQDIRASLGCAHSVYHLAPTGSPDMEIPFLRTTYSPDWIMRYIMRNYPTSDPVLHLGLTSPDAFFWSDVPQATDELAAFFKDAQDHGVGNCGYTIPIADRGGKRAMFTINSNAEPGEFKAWISHIEAHLKDIALILHRRALAETGVDTLVPLLSKREIECLNWTARGKDAPAVAETLAISEHTVRDYLKSAKKKLSCSTIAQAVYEATRLNLIKH